MSSVPSRRPVPVVLWVLLGVVVLYLGVSLALTADRFTWLLETAPVLIVLPILLATYRRFRLSMLLYVLIAIHALILTHGGHYTYAEVPLGFWVQDLLDLGRNHYDRLGHFAQGFIPAIAVRELLLRTSPLERGKWLRTIVTTMCLAFSAMYELIEWWTAAAMGATADSFLGSQGDIWDAQWDMFLALMGAIIAQLVLARLHDRSMAALDQP